MKLRIAKKVGRTAQTRHREITIKRAFRRFWKWDTRKHGPPVNMDTTLAMVYGYPTFGGEYDAS